MAPYERMRRFVRFNYLKLLRLKTSARELAMGLAVGVFAGCLPAIPGTPLQTVAALVLAFLLRGNKIAAVIATYHSNPLNWVFFWYVEYKIGKWVLPFDVQFDPMNMRVEDLATFGWQGLSILIVGGAILGLPLGIGTYFVSLPLIRNYRRRRALRLLRKKTGQD